jgi:hypothetical protein
MGPMNQSIIEAVNEILTESIIPVDQIPKIAKILNATITQGNHRQFWNVNPKDVRLAAKLAELDTPNPLELYGVGIFNGVRTPRFVGWSLRLNNKPILIKKKEEYDVDTLAKNIGTIENAIATIAPPKPSKKAQADKTEADVKLIAKELKMKAEEWDDGVWNLFDDRSTNKTFYEDGELMIDLIAASGGRYTLRFGIELEDRSRSRSRDDFDVEFTKIIGPLKPTEIKRAAFVTAVNAIMKKYGLSGIK